MSKQERLLFKRLLLKAIEKAKKIIPDEISPITDVRATEEYRMHMCKVMFERGLKTAVSRLDGNGHDYGEEVI